MDDILRALVYLVTLTFSVSMGLWLCKYTYLHSQEPEKLVVIKHQIRDSRLAPLNRVGVFCSLEPLPMYPGFYSGLSENTDKEHPSVGFPKCPASSHRQCTNNVYSAAVNPVDNEDYFDRSLIPIGSNNKCQYGSTYSSCYPKNPQTEAAELNQAACNIKDQVNDSSAGNRVNIYNMSNTEVWRGDN